MNIEIKQPREMVRRPYEREFGDQLFIDHPQYNNLQYILFVAYWRAHERDSRQEVRKIARGGLRYWLVQDIR